MSDENLEKYRELYVHSKQLLFREQERFTRIDQKASWHLSALTVLIGIGGFLAKWIVNTLLPPSGIIEWFLFVLGLFFGVFLIAAWFTCFSVLKLKHEIRHLPLNQSVLNLFRNNQRIQAYYTIAKKSQEAFECNVIRATKKARRLGRGYTLTVISLVFLIIFSFLYVTYHWDANKHEQTYEVCTPTNSVKVLEKGEN